MALDVTSNTTSPGKDLTKLRAELCRCGVISFVVATISKYYINRLFLYLRTDLADLSSRFNQSSISEMSGLTAVSQLATAILRAMTYT